MFLTFTEAVLGYALTKTADGVQITLTIFVIGFALLVAGAFFAVLWFRPHHFYAPADFGDMAPKDFVDALRGVPQEAVLQAARVTRDPTDKTAVYQFLSYILDHTFQQHLILMAENSVEIPYDTMMGHPYDHGTRNRNSAHGFFQAREFARKLEGTDFIEIVQQGGLRLRITDAGRAFAAWLVQNGKKDEFLQTPFGGWGVPFRITKEGKVVDVQPQAKSPAA